MKWIIPIGCVLLAGVSLVALRSIAPELMQRQLLYFLLGFVLFYLANRINFQTWLKGGFLFYLILILVLLLLLALGTATRSTMRWIDLAAGFRVQPSQFATLAASLLIASRWKFFANRGWVSLAALFTVILIPVLLVFVQPDFGTSMIILISLFSLFIFVPITFKQLAAAAFLGGVVLVAVWGMMLRPYQRARITSFFSGGEGELSATYNARQSLIAVGSGELYGRGLGAGVQSHLRFLPERQTDFVFASIAEEWGFVGSGLIVLIYLSMIISLMYSLLITKNSAKRVIILVLAVNLFFQAAINVGMNLGLAPITGLTLPLISYGGSSVISFMIFFGLAFKLIDDREPRVKFSIK